MIRSRVLQPEVARDEQAREAFDAAMAEEAENYRRIAELLQDGHIRRLMQEGADEKTAARKAEKMAIEDAVSYTHLDVYKRQSSSRLSCARLPQRKNV